MINNVDLEGKCPNSQIKVGEELEIAHPWSFQFPQKMLVFLFDIFVERENSLNLNKTGSKLQILWAKRPHFDAARTLNSGLIYTTVISTYAYICIPF